MIEETCLEIEVLEGRWLAEKRARTARRDKIHQIDDLIEEFERLNLADEVEVPIELMGRSVALLLAEGHPMATRAPAETSIAEWMDALYDVQDTLMFAADEGE